jgi:hypothetical protein
MATRMQQRRGTIAEWTAANPVLLDGEIGFETDTHFIRVGDGVTAFLDLPRYAGPQGPQGAQGAQGPQGVIGPQGPQGAQGAMGARGDTGPQGSTGPAGATGLAGSPGPQGPTGPPGATGPQGPAGQAGVQGLQGPQGAQGPQGSAGPLGPVPASNVSPGQFPAGTFTFNGDIIPSVDNTRNVGTSDHRFSFLYSYGVNAPWTTTASAANLYSGAGNNILKSTSSITYKTSVQDMEPNHDVLDLLRPVTFQDKKQAAKDPNAKHHVGLIAEEVHDAGLHELVHYEFPWEFVLDEEGNNVYDEENLPKIIQTGPEFPNGVQYDRIVVMLLPIIKDLRNRVVELEKAANTKKSNT